MNTRNVLIGVSAALALALLVILIRTVAPGRGGSVANNSAEELRLKLIEMKDRSAAAGTFSPTRYAQPDPKVVVGELESFLNKLKSRQSSSASSGPGASAGAEGEGIQSGGGNSPIFTGDALKGKHGSPTLELLEQTNRDGGHSVQMSGDPGLEDGSRDKSGKKFDGNQAIFGTVPIEETSGAFGKKSIRKSDSEPATGGAAGN